MARGFPPYLGDQGQSDSGYKTADVRPIGNTARLRQKAEEQLENKPEANEENGWDACDISPAVEHKRENTRSGKQQKIGAEHSRDGA